MNTKYTYIYLSVASCLCALLFFAVYNQWIIFRSPFSENNFTNVSAVLQKKQIVLHYFHGDKWKTEKQELLWSENHEKNSMHLINAWLAVLDEERILAKKTTLQSALISASGCAYLSFDHNILNKEETIFKKWMLLEGLLTTIRSNDTAISQVQFLVQHKPLHDAHLDVSFPWPISGFMKTD